MGFMSDMKTAILITLGHEGGFQKDPKDRANWSSGVVGEGTLVGTKYGITALDMPGADIENITEDQAVAFYERKFWNSYYAAINSQPIANKLFDLGVLFGEGTAVKALQTALDITADGIFGQVSLVRTNQANAALLLADFKAEMVQRAIAICAANLNDAEDLKGWETRVES